jgi:DNA-binding LytR/AlgR family response regulator
MTTDSVAALEFLDKNKPDIIFLDIQMPEINGIEFIGNISAKWGNNMPKIVFATGYVDFAFSGYECGIVDYLLKPVTFIRFKKCIDRIIDELDKRNNQIDKPTFLFVEDDGRKVKINFDDIILVEGAGNYIIIMHYEHKRVIYKSMMAMLDLLPPDKFIRVHKSYIVSINKVQAIRGNEIIVKLKNEEKAIPLGITYRENVLKVLGIN